MTSLEQTSYEPYKRYLLEIAYDGGNYSGWQIQPHCLAVQEVLQGILSKMYAGHPIHLIGSSRTDAGVHAQRFAAAYGNGRRIPDGKEQGLLRHGADRRAGCAVGCGGRRVLRIFRV